LPDGEKYREKAAHCLIAAHNAPDPSVRLTWLSLARNYMALADYLDRHGTARPGDQDQKDS
jgi:hypothetical protein